MSDEQPLIVEPTAEELAAANEREIRRELTRLSRRGFLTAAVAAAAGLAGWRWLMKQPMYAGIQEPFRRTLQINEELSENYFRRRRLSPEFSFPEITPRARINGHIGLSPDFGPESWRLNLEGVAGSLSPIQLTMGDIRKLPRRDMITELRCIEGWSIIVHWAGVRLADLMRQYQPPERTQYLAMETPGRGYYVGLDMASALHPQTLLAYEMNGQPLDWHHGAPLRLAIPVKYGIKNIKRISVIRFTDVRPGDFWAERGYDWYAGH